jgi:hypothetical protein
MTLSAASTSVIYIGTGATGGTGAPFDVQSGGIPIYFRANSHIKVEQQIVATGAIVPMIEGIDYELTGGPDAGKVRRLAGHLPSGFKWAIYRDQPYAQDVDLATGGDFAAVDVESSDDRSREIDQELQGQAARSLKTDVFGASYDAGGRAIRNGAPAIDAADFVTYSQLQAEALAMGTGNVIGAAASTDNAIARFDGVSGKILQNSAATISDAGGPSFPGGLVLSGAISPAQITADQNDYAPSGFGDAFTLRLSSDAYRTITGIAGGSGGRLVTIDNVGTFPLRLKEASASSAAGNRFSFGADIMVASGKSVLLRYDATASRWRHVAMAGLANSGAFGVYLEDYGGAGDGTTDNTAALNAAVADLGAQNTNIIRLRGDGATYRFASKPNDFTVPVTIVGESYSTTYLLRDYSASGTESGFLTWSGAGSIGGSIERCQVRAGNGTSSGTMLKFVTGINEIAGFNAAENVVVTFTGTGTYERALLVDGVLNATSGGQGMRDFTSHGLYLFKGASNTESARFKNATNLAADIWANGDVVVTGGGSALTNTTDARLTVTCLGQLFVGNALRVAAQGIVGTLNLSTGSERCSFIGVVSTATGGIANVGASNLILANDSNHSFGFVLAQSAVAASHTGNTTETTLATVTIPAGTMGGNGSVAIETLWSYTNSANNKTLFVRFGGTGGTAYRQIVLTTTDTVLNMCQVFNRNSQSSQIGSPAAAGGGYGAVAAANVTSAVNTANATDISIRCQLANSGETITLEAYRVIVYPRS